MDDVKAKNGIDEWMPGLYDADITFAYPEGVYSSGVTATASVFVQATGVQPQLDDTAGEGIEEANEND